MEIMLLSKRNVHRGRERKTCSKSVEARKIIQSQAASRSGQSFAAAAATRAQPAITQTSCVGTQTDLTWPDPQSEPAPLNTFEKSVHV